MKLMHLTLCASLALFGLAPAAAQQHPASGEAAYPDTPEGLQKQLEDILQAYKAGDTLKAEKLIKNFCLSDIETAWARVFGTEPRESLAKSYTLECANFESSLGSRLLLLAKTENAEILVRPPVTPTSQSQTGKPQANASVKLYLWELRGGDQSPFISLAFFANLHGAFHFFGEAPPTPSAHRTTSAHPRRRAGDEGEADQAGRSTVPALGTRGESPRGCASSDPSWQRRFCLGGH